MGAAECERKRASRTCPTQTTCSKTNSTLTEMTRLELCRTSNEGPKWRHSMFLFHSPVTYAAKSFPGIRYPNWRCERRRRKVREAGGRRERNAREEKTC